ncbi:hypothetical protein BDA99DRAFT_540893 [Phascolomyces articulosus]|uniref:Uncharacterized protein n=1 Tax=Phascolomyces articulosus TaxID=60185 RepID=A0AAD5PC15_9FUNG|nr:hypothetical protein BDA99DRAFT_540893 [Phascolomyces articulosus]
MFICNGTNYQSKLTLMRFIMLSSVIIKKDITDRIWTISESNPSIRIRIRMTDESGKPDFGEPALLALTKIPLATTTKSDSSTTPKTLSISKHSTPKSSASKASISTSTIEELFEKLDSRKWTLSTGKVVEETMKYPAHSLILDVDDDVWVRDGHFTEEEVEGISGEHCLEDPELSPNITKYLNGYLEKYTHETIFEQAKHVPFDPKKEPDLFLIHQTMLKILNLFGSNYLPVTNNSESEFVTENLETRPRRIRRE